LSRHLIESEAKFRLKLSQRVRALKKGYHRWERIGRFARVIVCGVDGILREPSTFTSESAMACRGRAEHGVAAWAALASPPSRPSMVDVVGAGGQGGETAGRCGPCRW